MLRLIRQPQRAIIEVGMGVKAKLGGETGGERRLPRLEQECELSLFCSFFFLCFLARERWSRKPYVEELLL